MTPLARPAIDGSVPGFAFKGNRAGTGKGKLIDSIGVIVTGRPVPCTSYPQQREEAAKLKVALTLAATPIVHLDNLEEGCTYGDGVLDSALTARGGIGDRILGVSRTVEGLELRCCWYLSGNNVSPSKDAYRRWLVCNLITALEHPEERGDLIIPDIIAYVREHRAEMVRAALVILKAHAAAGRPTGGWAPLGSFEEWDRIVRGAVWYATGRDCNATRHQAAEESPDHLARLALSKRGPGCRTAQEGGNGVTAVAAHETAVKVREKGETECDILDALMQFSQDGKVPSPRSIGTLLRAMKGRNIDGRAF